MHSKDNALNRGEFIRFLGACQDNKDKVLVILLGALGLRAGEVAHLRATWIDWQSSIIRIPENEGDWTPKTRYGIRAIPFGSMSQARDIISHFFALNDSLNLGRVGIWKRIRRIAKRVPEVKKQVTPHALRATAAFQLAEAGFSSQALRQFFGWSRLSTAEVYILRSGQAAIKELEEHKEKLWV